jgi:hypothetical protein
MDKSLTLEEFYEKYEKPLYAAMADYHQNINRLSEGDKRAKRLFKDIDDYCHTCCGGYYNKVTQLASYNSCLGACLENLPPCPNN